MDTLTDEAENQTFSRRQRTSNNFSVTDTALTTERQSYIAFINPNIEADDSANGVRDALDEIVIRKDSNQFLQTTHNQQLKD